MPPSDPFRDSAETFARQKKYFSLFFIDFLFGIGVYVSVLEGFERGFGSPSAVFVTKGGAASPIWLTVAIYCAMTIGLGVAIYFMWRAEKKARA